jgi:hypothetical protein
VNMSDGPVGVVGQRVHGLDGQAHLILFQEFSN